MDVPVRSDDVSDQRRGWVLLLGIVMSVFLLGACTDDSAGPTTSPVTVDESSELSSFVLVEQSVASIAGFENVVAQPLNDVDVFENPDPRGPCGGESPAPPLEGTAGAVFAAPGLSIVQVVAEGADVDAFFEAQLGDIVDPCGPYESTTDAETVQEVDQIVVATLPDDLGYFQTARLSTGGQTAFTGSGVVRNSEGVTSLVFAVSVQEIPFASIESLIRLVDAQLNNG